MTAPYLFVEYPKWVTPEGRTPVVVHSAEHEAAVLGTGDAGPTPEAGKPEKETLQEQATELGIPWDGRWSVKRLQTEIDAALAAPPDNQE